MRFELVFFLPFLGHFALVVFLYAWLTYARQISVRNSELQIGDFVNAGADKTRSKRIARNLSNQFELPVFTYFAALYISHSNAIDQFDIIAAWVFLIGRLLHTGVQTLTDNIRLRGQVFTINFLGTLWLMAKVANLVLFP
jgi:hypothetical protein